MAEERVKPRSMFVEEAVQQALESRWADALATNQALMEKYGADEETHNRVGKALTELGRLPEALESYSASLTLNPLNLIAQKNVRKLAALLESKETVATAAQPIDVEAFTEEPGKSALTVLTPPARKVTVSVAPGDVVELQPNSDQLLAETGRGVPLGAVDTKIARRLLPLMATGNRYSAAVARIDDHGIEIIIREAYQAPENAHVTSFQMSRARRDEFRPYAKDSLLASREIDAESAGEDDEEYTEPSNEPSEDLAEMGMSTFQGDSEESSSDNDSDEDTRPEDEY
ncbi:MAG: tetratricopeptide repeat protein [Candidatus Dormibacteraeota bacterium]|nr:tetratricopeptide repeat protein [Candidatus Dormibacteraeota bacterium]